MSSTRIAKELKKIRVDHELSRKEMAAQLDLTEKQVSDIELGKTELSIALLNKITDKYFSGSDKARERIRQAAISSIPFVTFDLSNLDDEDIEEVHALRDKLRAKHAITLKNFAQVAIDAANAVSEKLEEVI